MFFKCKHPFDYLVVRKESLIKEQNNDFEFIEYYFLCQRCGKDVTSRHAKLIDGVDTFLKRRKT